MNPSDPIFPLLPQNVGPVDAPAFIQHRGLTKREWFAGLAMQGMSHADHCHHEPEFAAKYSVQMADALIAELSKERK